MLQQLDRMPDVFGDLMTTSANTAIADMASWREDDSMPLPFFRITAGIALFKRARQELQKYAAKHGMTEKEALSHLAEKVKKPSGNTGKRPKK